MVHARSSTGNVVRFVRQQPRHTLILAVVIIILLGIFLFNRGDAHINNTRISNLKTYRLLNAGTSERVAQSTFQTSEPIQVGFDYTELTEAQSKDALVQFVVTSKKSDKPVFTTTKFKLEPGRKSLFVNINNTNLPPENYTVQLRDSEARAVAELNFVIKAR